MTRTAEEKRRGEWYEALARSFAKGIAPILDAAIARADAEIQAERDEMLADLQRAEALHAAASSEVVRLTKGIEKLAAEGEAWGKGVAVALSSRLRELVQAEPERDLPEMATDDADLWLGPSFKRALALSALDETVGHTEDYSLLCQQANMTVIENTALRDALRKALTILHPSPEGSAALKAFQLIDNVLTRTPHQTLGVVDGG